MTLEEILEWLRPERPPLYEVKDYVRFPSGRAVHLIVFVDDALRGRTSLFLPDDDSGRQNGEAPLCGNTSDQDPRSCSPNAGRWCQTCEEYLKSLEHDSEVYWQRVNEMWLLTHGRDAIELLLKELEKTTTRTG